MFDGVLDNIRVIGPVFAAVWILTILSATRRPQRFLNSILLMAALLVTLLFIAGLLGDEAGADFLLVCFLLVMLALLLVPLLLIVNGIQMIKKESVCAAHLLSLGLGIAVAIGEIAAIVYVFSLSELIDLRSIHLWLLLIVFTVFYFSFLVLSFVLYSLFIQIIPHRRRFDYVIIHGCGLAEGEELSKLLAARVDKAVKIYRRVWKKPVVIPSGGQGADEKISEAEAMKRYLIEHGVQEKDIVVEDRSATTRENLVFSKEIIDAREGKKRTALVSSNYHIYRCLRLAREVGLPCTGIGAHVALYYWPSALIREFIAVFSTKRFLIWTLIGWLLFISPLIYAMIAGI